MQEIIEYVMRSYARTGRLPRGEKQVRDGGAVAEKYRSAQRAEDDFSARSRRGVSATPGAHLSSPRATERGIAQKFGIDNKSFKEKDVFL